MTKLSLVHPSKKVTETDFRMRLKFVPQNYGGTVLYKAQEKTAMEAVLNS